MTAATTGAGTTIAAVASPSGPARRGILRVSGPRAAELSLSVLTGESPRFDASAARALHRGRFDDGRGTQPVTLLWMRGPRSYTREDVAEFHLPGAPPLVACALARLVALGAEPARPGEFTRRAFVNGRLDLPGAEGVLALIEAGDEAERRAAALLFEGGLGRRTRDLGERLLELALLCEASLDFDETDTGHVPLAELFELGERTASALEEALSAELRRSAPDGLPRVVLAGAPNAGKSSLWNALTGGAALVSDHAGTTRDVLEGLWELGDTVCVLADGPGVVTAASTAEATAQRLSRGARERADLVLWVIDAARPAPGDAALGEDGELPPSTPRIHVWNKSDLAPGAPVRAAPAPGVARIDVSARERTGLDALRRAVARELDLRLGRTGEAGIDRALSLRHREALSASRVHLGEALELLRSRAPVDLAAEALRSSRAALDDLAGRTTPEDVLDGIFARFCIGK